MVKIFNCLGIKVQSDFMKWREHYKISKMQRHKGSVDLRVISDTLPCEEAVSVQGSRQNWKCYIKNVIIMIYICRRQL